jgi:GTP-binding protein Era
MIKKIGSAARKEIEAMSGRKIYLRLRVKTKKNWRNNEHTLKLFGFKK